MPCMLCVFLIPVLTNIVHSQSIDIIYKGGAFCGETISDIINSYEWHDYSFTINSSYDVNIETCTSDTDVYVLIYDSNFNIVSYDNCDYGDSCGSCMLNGTQIEYMENFTIPLQPSQYYISITPFNQGVLEGAYEFDVNCIASKQEPVQKIRCGETISGIINSNEWHDYSFTINSWYDVNIETCTSDIGLNVTIYDRDFSEVSYDSCFSGDYCGSCILNGTSANYMVNFTVPLQPSKYYINISPYDRGAYQFELTCTNTSYILVEWPEVDNNREWYDAERECRENYGTSLATVLTVDDLCEIHESFYATHTTSHLFHGWVGMYTDGTTWQWMTGNSCDDSHWDLGAVEPRLGDAYYMSRGVYVSLMGDEYGCYINNETVNFFSSYDYEALFKENFTTIDSYGFICNSPYGRYTETTCTDKRNCWTRIGNSTDSPLLSDMDIHYITNTFISWDSKVFIVGLTGIHYSKYIYDLFDSTYKYEWNHATINYPDSVHIKYWHNVHQQFSQFESSLFMRLGDLSEAVSYLLHINLTDFSVRDLKTWGMSILALDYTCMVASAKHVYMFYSKEITIYDIKNDFFNTKEFYDHNIYACAITEDAAAIYVFSSFEKVVKYNTITSYVSTLTEHNKCNDYDNYAVHNMGTISKNNKIYLHGCYLGGSWKTLIFNVKTETFETNTINVDNPLTKYIPWYKTGQITGVDDNILLMVHSVDTYYPLQTSKSEIPQNKSIQLYYAITDLISINFRDTQLIYINSGIWPSDGFIIKYYVNDLNAYQAPKMIYNLWINSNNNISAMVKLNKSNDNCICNESTYKCYNCQQYFDLNHHFDIIDNKVDELQFSMMPDSLEEGITLIIPDLIAINLKRCHIWLINNDQISTNDELLIGFNYTISKSCYERVGKVYCLNIQSIEADINQKLCILAVDNSDTITCEICDIFFNCVDCKHGYFQLKHAVVFETETFDISFTPNVIDVSVKGPNQFSIVYSKVKNRNLKQSFWESLSVVGKFGIIIGAIIFVLSVSLIIYYYKKFAHEKAIRLKFAKDICNPMVISIGIAFYNQEAGVDAGLDVHCPTLDGIDRDYHNIKTLCKLLNWTIYPAEDKFEWTQNEIITFIQQRAKEASDNVMNRNISNSEKYDSIFVIISGHGLKSGIISSDMQLISKTAIHRLFSTNFYVLRELPRIFVFDCCAGTQQKSHYTAEYNSDDSDTGQNINYNQKEKINSDSEDDIKVTDAGKNFYADDINITQYEEEIWKQDQLNPDYMLTLVHAANEGFQAKMNSLTGSYLIYEFVKRMIANIEGNKNLFLGEIFDSIQQDLHDQGKQQITSIFNNNSRYLRFKQNNYEEKQIIDNKTSDNLSNVMEAKQSSIEMGQIEKYKDTKMEGITNDDLDENKEKDNYNDQDEEIEKLMVIADEIDNVVEI